MNKNIIEARISEAFEQETPDIWEKINKNCSKEITFDDKVVEMDTIRKKKGLFATITAIAASFLLILTGTCSFVSNNRVAAIVTIDVNPSVQLDVNKDNEVIDANALNDDAQKILNSLDLDGENLDKAVDKVLGAIVDSGYLGNKENAILISVQNIKNEDFKSLDAMLNDAAKITLASKGVHSNVIVQNVKDNAKNKALAEKLGISEGKAQYINKIAGDNKNVDLKKLSKMNISELNAYNVAQTTSKATNGQTVVGANENGVTVDTGDASVVVNSGGVKVKAGNDADVTASGDGVKVKAGNDADVAVSDGNVSVTADNGDTAVNVGGGKVGVNVDGHDYSFNVPWQ